MNFIQPFWGIVIAILSIQNVQAANILFIHPFASFSHRVSMEPLAIALLEKGHNITYIAPMPSSNPHPKIHDIMPETFKNFVDMALNAEFNVEVRIEKRMPQLFTMLDQLGLTACEILLNSVEFQEWIKASPKIDLVIADLLSECPLGIAYKLNAKLISYSTVAFWGKYMEDLGLPQESVVTNCDLAFKPTMTFWERVKNTLLPLAWSFFGSQTQKHYESVISSGLNISNLPPMNDLLHNISLVFMTGNYISEQTRSLPPMFVSIPGLHVKTTRHPLPSEIEKFINAPESDGFVYISLGTVVVAPNLPQNIRDVFMNTIKAFPRIKFLWRWGGDFPQNKPDNLMMAKWFPQQDVLQHPKIKAFVSQVGRPSLQEALASGVPIIGFPILGDQDYNAMRVEQLGIGKALEIGDVTEAQFKDALSQAIYDATMRANAKKMSSLFKDLPMKPVDTAVWWTEYVLRNDDLSHLKPMAIKQTWYQRRLLDVWAFLAILAATVFCVIGLFLVITIKFILSSYYFRTQKEKMS